jgi:hypothetical protein
MQGMTSENIRSGSQVIIEFLVSLQGDENVDVGTLTEVRELFEAGKLSKTRLLNSLATLRTDAAQRNNAVPKIDNSDDD